MLSRSFNYNKLIYVSSLVRFVFIDNDGSSVFWPQTGKKVNQLCVCSIVPYPLSRLFFKCRHSVV